MRFWVCVAGAVFDCFCAMVVRPIDKGASAWFLLAAACFGVGALSAYIQKRPG